MTRSRTWPLPPRRLPRASTYPLIALALVLAVLLSACARIPIDGPVSEGDRVDGAPQGDVLFYPQPPADGASAEEIVAGFIGAATGTSDNYEVARQYLTANFAAEWDPTASVTVYGGSLEILASETDRIQVAVDSSIEIDADGRMQRFEEPQRSVSTFELERVEGEWRISSAPQGITLLSENFSQIFAAYTLYFVDSSRSFLVPESRWFPSHSTAPTRITQALLRGPSSWLAEGGVRTMFPEGTQLLGPISAREGAATANFSTTISAAPADDFSYMQLQLVESLRGVQTIGEIGMAVNGARLEVEVPPAGAIQTHPQVNSTPLVYREGQLGYLSGNSLTPILGAEGLAATISQYEPSAGAVSMALGQSVFLTPDGIIALPTTGGAPVPIDDRAGLLMPTLDPFGWVWTTRADSDFIRVTRAADGEDEFVEMPSFEGGTLRDVQASRDGSQVAMLIERDGRVEVRLYAVSRGEGGAPERLGSPLVFRVPGTTAHDLTWVDETSLATLTSDGNGTAQVTVTQIGGVSTDYGVISGGVAITGSNTIAGLRVVDFSGRVHIPRGNVWQASGATVGFLVTQV